MAKITVKRKPPPPVESITIEITPSEFLDMLYGAVRRYRVAPTFNGNRQERWDALRRSVEANPYASVDDADLLLLVRIEDALKKDGHNTVLYN